MSEQPTLEHPTDHEPFFLLLRQEQREGGLVVDVFYCARCLGRIEVEATGTPVSGEFRHRGPLPALGSAARGT